jgi:hypothetical protein
MFERRASPATSATSSDGDTEGNGYGGNDGSFGIEIDPGTYFLKFSKQGYEELPPKDISPLPLGILTGQVTDYSVQMFKSAIINGGGLSGKVVANGTGLPGVLVVAESGADGFSAGTDVSGNYAIYNVPANSYTVKAWYSDHNSTEANVTVIAGTEQSNVDLTLTQGVTGAVTGQISFLATTNAEVDVALLNPLSRETIPGLSVMTVGQDFTIQNVPDGTYLARATYRNDGKVVDPDWIIKNGEPYVTVSGGSVSRDFSVTGAVELLSPTNSPMSTQPVDVSGSGLTFSWASYSSTDGYVIEVTGQNGSVIWGGFTNNWTAKRITIPKTQTSVQFNSDSTATEGLAVGKIYRWKIYASKDDLGEPTGWKLISVSEDQRGLIRIVP